MSSHVAASRAPTSLERFVGEAIPPAVHQISRSLSEAGFRAWLVGGSVRDLVRGFLSATRIAPKDWDLATDATPEQVRKLFRRVIPTGIAHGTVTIVLSREHYEITTLRGERGFSDGRHPDEVFFVKELEADLARRDFTVNAIAYDLSAGHINDPFGGQEDLERKVLRAVGAAEARFLEDGLRVMRCARFASTLELDIEEQTRAALRPALGSLQKVAAERIRDEWLKALASRAPSRALLLMHAEGIGGQLAPRMFSSTDDARVQRACQLLDQAATVSENSRRSPTDIEQLALLCCVTFELAERDAETLALAQKFKLSGQQKRYLQLLVTCSEPPPLPSEHEPSLLPFRRWLQRVGRDNVDDVLALQERLEPQNTHLGSTVRRLTEEELSGCLPLTVRELAVTGGELISELGLPPGPWVGERLEQLLACALEDPSTNQREHLLALARQLG